MATSPASWRPLLPFFLQAAAWIMPVTSASAEGFLHMPIIHSTNTAYFEKRAIEMGSVVHLSLANQSDIAYYAQLGFGTPAQNQLVQLDTGSFELWVNPQCGELTGDSLAFCTTAGQYEASNSTTAVPLNTAKMLNYGIGSANVSYMTDTVSIPGSDSNLTAVQFGVATQSRTQFSGILGIGYGNGITLRYNNLVDQLKLQGVIHVKAYTLALGSKDEQEGVILFGAVDTARFDGSLTRLPIIPAAQSPDKVPRFWVNLMGISLSPPGDSPNIAYDKSSVPVFLDSGSTMTLLPKQLTDRIAADFGAPPADSDGFYSIDCAFTQIAGTVDFAFNGTTIKVPYREMVREVISDPDPPSCFLGISPSTDFMLLGDTFLRSAYTLIDLEKHNVWIAQSMNCGSNPAALNNTDVLSSLRSTCGTATTNDGSTGNVTATKTTTTTTSPGPVAPETSAAPPPPSSGAPNPASPGDINHHRGDSAASGRAGPNVQVLGVGVFVAAVLWGIF